MNTEKSLHAAVEGKITLTDEDINSLEHLLTKRCNARTKYAVRQGLHSITHQPNHGIYERVVWHPKGGWQYVAGQSYPEEVATVRSLLRGW